jgi:hypothetical protein
MQNAFEDAIVVSYEGLIPSYETCQTQMMLM